MGGPSIGQRSAPPIEYPFPHVGSFLLLIHLPLRRHGLTAKYIDISFSRCRNIVPYCKSFKMSNFFFFEFLRTLVSIGLNWSQLV